MATSDIWSRRPGTALVDPDGHTVMAPDGVVGVVDGRRSDLSRGWLVVDVPLRFRRRSIIVPAGIAASVDAQSRSILLAVSRAYVIDGPELFDGDDAAAEDLLTDVAVYYQSIISSRAPVLPNPGYMFHPRRRPRRSARSPGRGGGA